MKLKLIITVILLGLLYNCSSRAEGITIEDIVDESFIAALIDDGYNDPGNLDMFDINKVVARAEKVRKLTDGINEKFKEQYVPSSVTPSTQFLESNDSFRTDRTVTILVH